MSDTLRSGLIRLAFANPSLRADLLPLIEKEAAGPSYKDYVEKKRKKGEKPLDEAAWESRVKGKGEGSGAEKSEKGKKSPSSQEVNDTVDEVLSTTREKYGPEEFSHYAVVDAKEALLKSFSGTGATQEDLDKAWKQTLKRIESGLEDEISSLEYEAGGEDDEDEYSQSVRSAMGEWQDSLDVFRRAVADGNYKAPKMDEPEVKPAKAKKPATPKSEKPKAKSEKPKASFKKNYRPTMESVMTKHSLTDDDAAEVIKFSIDRPKKGKEQSPAELMRRFMENAKPETKERMKGMNPAEFMKMLRAVLDDEEGGGGKTASLRSGLIRLAYANPSLRPTLLPLIEKHAGEMDAELDEDADPTSHDQNLPEHYYFNKGAAKGESVEAILKQFASPASKNQNKPESYYGLAPKGKQAAKEKNDYSPSTFESIDLRDDLVKALKKKGLEVEEGSTDNTLYIDGEKVAIHGSHLEGEYVKEWIRKPSRKEWLDEAVKLLGKKASVKTAGGSGAANAAFLRQSPLKNKVLQAVAKHYGVSVSEIEDELTDPDAEALYEYIGNDRALQMQVYREFKK